VEKKKKRNEFHSVNSFHTLGKCKHADLNLKCILKYSILIKHYAAYGNTQTCPMMVFWWRQD